MVTFGGLALSGMTPNSGVFAYDPTSNTWAQLDDMPFTGWLMNASEVNGKIYVFGGLAQKLFDSFENPQPLSSVWEVSIEP
jgi:N-acetylneuraminic acid mutarotase